MPCYDSRTHTEPIELQAALDLATRVACTLSRLIHGERVDIGAVLEASDWIDAHGQADAKRGGK